jgi:hypothetical protein
MTLVFCGIPYVAAGGPLPSLAVANAAVQKPLVSAKMDGPWKAQVSPVKATLTSQKTYYKVQAGDYLSKISAKFYHNPNDWTVLYWSNHRLIRYANNLEIGLVLVVPALPRHIPAPPAVLAPSAPRLSAPGSDAAILTASSQKTVEQAAPARTAPVSSGYSVSSSFQACVIRTESGGNAQIWNASGHYGLYQFAAGTWAAYGGNPADFGHASAAEQTQVFDNAIAAGGQSNWSLYDGC